MDKSEEWCERVWHARLARPEALERAVNNLHGQDAQAILNTHMRESALPPWPAF